MGAHLNKEWRTFGLPLRLREPVRGKPGTSPEGTHRSSACRVLYHGAIADLRPGAAHSGAHGYNGRGVSRPAGRRLCVMGEKRGWMVAFSSRQLVIKPPLRKALCQECVELRLGVP